ncbi:MAG: FkbM family methyltransferase [Candidatus Wallbacteria bacterium]|nr:FkbM family methyltransferase [Candidatus Wallbacteria bacterium]
MSRNALRLKPYSAVTPALCRTENLLESILTADPELKPRKVDKPVVLYGAGKLGKMAKKFFNHLNLQFSYVVDKNAAACKTDKFWQDTSVIHPDQVSAADKKNSLLVICIVTIPLIALRDELKATGWEDIALFYDVSEAYSCRYPISNGWFLGKVNQSDRESVRTVFSAFADDASRLHYLQFLAWRKLRIELLFNLEINNDNRFFIREITGVLREDEVFVDCGAHQGSVTEKFLKTVRNKYREISAIEPDGINFELLKANLNHVANLNFIKCGLSDRNGREKFCQGFDFASKLSKNGLDLVETVRLDSLNLSATLIKMHLEGGELAALKGATDTIRRYRPIVAATVYHNSDGVLATPQFVMSNTMDYEYYFRLHSWGGTGAVFYAVPVERSNKSEEK